jgi:hypothetical protein
LQEDVLLLSDPRALQYILQQSGYKYPRTEEEIQGSLEFTGSGILAAYGEFLAYYNGRNVLKHTYSLR